MTGSTGAVVKICTLISMFVVLTSAVPLGKGGDGKPTQVSSKDVTLFQEPVCFNVNKMYSTDVGCEADLELKTLVNLQALSLKCRPKDLDATCEWTYGNIHLGKSTENVISTHDTHTFVPVQTDLFIVAGAYKLNLVRKTFTCTCYSENGHKESRSTTITCPDFQDS